MKQTIIFGTGKFLEESLSRICLDHVDAFVDNDSKKWGLEFHGRKILSPAALKSMEIAHVYIASTRFFSEIYEQLIVDCGVGKENIKGIQCLVYLSPDPVDGECRNRACYQEAKDIAESLAFLGAISVYDYAKGLRGCGVLSPYDSRLKLWRDMGRWHFVFNANQETPDTVLFVNPFERMSLNDLTEKIHHARKQWNCSCLIAACGQWDNESESWIRHLRSDFPKVISQQHVSCVTVLIPGGQMPETSIYTVVHKPYLPSLWSGEDAGYETVFAGAKGKNIGGGLRDDYGDNISYLNDKINECTAIYWIWKHCPKEIVGFCHYRRFFLSHETAGSRNQILTKGEAWRYLQDADILVANPIPGGHGSIIGTIQATTQPEAFSHGWDIIRRMVEEHHPEDLELLDDVMHGIEMYPCNMFVTRWRIFDAYCTWLFSFLIPAAKEVDVSCFDTYSKRIIGFFAERMLTVWLVKHPELRIKMLPVLQIDA